MIRYSAVVLVLLAACSPSAPSATTTATPLVAISADELRRDLVVFAADSFMGRETGTAGAVKAARFLAERMISLGIEPAGDSMYHQRVPLIRQSLGSDSRIAVQRGQSTIPLEFGTDVVPLTRMSSKTP